MGDYEDLLSSLSAIAQSMEALNRRAVDEYRPIVEDIIRGRSRDINEIEHTLDGILGFCSHEPALVLYKRLCRYYWTIDQEATAFYVHAYREMWDSEDVSPGDGPSRTGNGAGRT